MTMSVGLGRIITDPEASVIVRKALGILSTPGLLVHDTGLSIDDTGRIIVRLNPDGGLQQDEDGLALATVEETFGIDSFVDLNSTLHDREWNARLTGSAPNYIESSLAIGDEELGGAPASGFEVEDAKVQITAPRTQLRLSYDPQTYMAVRVLSTGVTEVFAVGTTAPAFHFITGDSSIAGLSGGVRINGGAVVEQIDKVVVTFSFAGGGTLGAISWEMQTATITPGTVLDWRDTDMVTVVPINSTTGSIQVEWLSWCAWISADNQVTIRVCWFDVTGADSRDWLLMIHRFT